MRVLNCFVVVLVLLCGYTNTTSARIPIEEATRALPREVSGFRLTGVIRPSESCISGSEAEVNATQIPCADFASAAADYLSPSGEKFYVQLVRVGRDSDAYSLLTQTAQRLRASGQASDIKLTRAVGTASFSLPGRVVFFKGTSFVIVGNSGNVGSDSTDLINFAKGLAETVNKGEGDVPILVKHLPQWETAQAHVTYLSGFRSLSGLAPNQPVPQAVTSEGDADAVLATYGAAQFLLVEFNTPQLAGDNDRAIKTKLDELRQQGQPVPTSYRKVGNYSVFVFNAASEGEAQSLIDQVEYAQVVQWLGDNPYRLEQAQKEYYEQTAGVLVSVVKASGLSLLICLGVGGVIGAALFSRRRAQQRAAEAYSDAGGMLRLNLDGITPQHDPARLLRP
mgnify:CR=1 FL=1